MHKNIHTECAMVFTLERLSTNTNQVFKIYINIQRGKVE